MKDFELKENTHLVLKTEDLAKHLNPVQRNLLDQILVEIYDGRKSEGKEPVNKYYLCNQDEHYSRDILDLIKLKILLRDVTTNDLIPLGEDGEWFAIEREVFDRLFKELDPIDPSSGFDEEELMKLLLIDWYEFIANEKAVEVEVKEWFKSIEVEDNDEIYYRKDKEDKGKHYSFHLWFDTK